LCFLPFGVVNGVLTSVPVVSYNPSGILGPRVFSIPIEDFLYSFSMLGLLILVYRLLRPRFRTGDTGDRGVTP
ncbi:MAG TPA: lycopene cyclase domain-containing protein, partial [Spirochaetia bacterium]|nr:lycopene cyclase domain-containing protein [Spirochaetia bacterium]